MAFFLEIKRELNHPNSTNVNLVSGKMYKQMLLRFNFFRRKINFLMLVLKLVGKGMLYDI